MSIKDFHNPKKSTTVIEAIHQHVRTKIPHIEEDQPMQEILDTALAIIKSGELVEVAKTIASENSSPYFGENVELFEKF